MLVASFVVLVGAAGVLFTAAWALDLAGAWAAAIATTGILVVYTRKSVPQTLALGRFGGAEETTTAMP